MEKTQIIIGGLTILEPMTALTDMLVSVVCFYAFAKLKQRSQTSGYMQLYPYFFLAMGISTLSGAVMTHAFSYIFQNEPDILPDAVENTQWFYLLEHNYQKLPSWIFNIISVTIFTFAMIYRSEKFFGKKIQAILYSFSILETIAMLSLMIYKMTFMFAEMHIGISLWIISMPVQIKIWQRHRKREALIIMLATFTTSLTGIVLAPKLSLGKWFNHFDISHVIIAISMYFFYLAGLCWHNDYDNETTNAN